MPQLLSLSRAARLAGVSRGQLQKQIREQGIETFEGEIAVSDLVRAYPDLDIEHDPVLERLERIKASTRPKSRYTDHWIPEPEVLMARLQDFKQVLARTKATLNGMEELLTEVTGQLQSMSDREDEQLRNDIRRLAERLQQSLQKACTRTDMGCNFIDPLRPLLFAQLALISGVNDDVIQVSITSASGVNSLPPHSGHLSIGQGSSSGSIG